MSHRPSIYPTGARCSTLEIPVGLTGVTQKRAVSCFLKVGVTQRIVDQCMLNETHPSDENRMVAVF